MNEQWTRWEPIAHLGNTYFLEHVYDGMRGLEILLEDSYSNDKKLRIIFAYTMISYTVNPTSASHISNKTQQIDMLSVDKDWSFFEVANSEYIAHLMEQSAMIVEIYEPRHFVILTVNARVNVVASYEPEVSWII